MVLFRIESDGFKKITLNLAFIISTNPLLRAKGKDRGGEGRISWSRCSPIQLRAEKSKFEKQKTSDNIPLFFSFENRLKFSRYGDYNRADLTTNLKAKTVPPVSLSPVLPGTRPRVSDGVLVVPAAVEAADPEVAPRRPRLRVRFF